MAVKGQRSQAYWRILNDDIRAFYGPQSNIASAASETLFARIIPFPQWNLSKEFNSRLSIVAEYF